MWAANEDFEKVVFCRRQVSYGAAFVLEFAARRVDLPAAEFIDLVLQAKCRRRRSATLMSPQDGANTGQDFAQVEWLRDVIVGAELKPDDTVNGIALALNHDDRHVSAGAYFTRKAQAVVLP